jgi:hypothetical protein
MQSGQQPALSHAYLDNPGEAPVSVSVEQLKRGLAVVLPGRDQLLLLAESAPGFPLKNARELRSRRCCMRAIPACASEGECFLVHPE